LGPTTNCNAVIRATFCQIAHGYRILTAGARIGAGGQRVESSGAVVVVVALVEATVVDAVVVRLEAVDVFFVDQAVAAGRVVDGDVVVGGAILVDGQVIAQLGVTFHRQILVDRDVLELRAFHRGNLDRAVVVGQLDVVAVLE